MKNISLFLCLTAPVLSSCKKDSAGTTTTTDCSTVAATFTTDVLPIFQSACSCNSNCHGAGSNEGREH